MKYRLVLFLENMLLLRKRFIDLVMANVDLFDIVFIESNRYNFDLEIILGASDESIAILKSRLDKAIVKQSNFEFYELEGGRQYSRETKQRFSQQPEIQDRLGDIHQYVMKDVKIL